VEEDPVTMRKEMEATRNRFARELFAPIAEDYEIWSRALSFGQDPRWRRAMVDRIGLPPGSKVLDVAAGTGQVTRLLEEKGYGVVALDQSPEMLAQALGRGSTVVNGRAEGLPFRDQTFDGLTFTYLLRYVEDPAACMAELTRVVRPGGRIAMVEFGRPRGFWGPWWYAFTRVGLPLAGVLIAPGWSRVGVFLGRSIDDFHDRYPMPELTLLWERAGLGEVRFSLPSLGGGLIMWGTRR
jgi:demethylmenaquinone methyltransferase / 2-methoxy-6-polyprenyl-1,4-benzoquinol methylase